jgi:hypothetical protein
MADATVGALRVTLGADTAAFEDGLKNAQSALSNFSKNVATIASGIGLEKIIEKSMQFVVSTISEGFDRIDKIGKEAQKTGVGVEAFSGLMLSADLADVSMQTLSNSLGKLSKNMVDTSIGTGEAKKTFDALGISVTDSSGTLKSADQVLIEVADKFTTAGDGATKTAAAIALFGKSGKELIPLLNEGAAGLEEMRKTAEQMGLVLDQNTANAVSKFNDNIKIIQKSGEGVANLVITAIIPALERLSEQFLKNVTDGNAIQQTANFIVTEFKALVTATFEVIAGFQALIDIGALVQQLWDTRNTELFNTALTNLQERVRQVPQDFIDAKKSADDMFATLTVGGKNITDTIEPAHSKLNDTIANLKLRAAEARGEFSNLATGFADTAAKLDLTDKAGQTLSRTVDGLTPSQAKLNQAMLEFQGAKVAQDALAPWEKYEQQIKAADLALQASGATAEQVGKVHFKIAEQTGQTWEQTSLSVLKGWGDAFTTMTKMNKDFAIASKAIAITQAIINGALAVTKVLAEIPPPFGWIAAAGVAAATAAQVALISAQTFAKGGSFRVGGGLTGLDSEMVAFKATPGEMVDIRRPGQTGGGGGGGGPPQTINLQMPRPADFFSLHVRELVYALNKAAPDGYVLKVSAA